jgi:hypothetical protein
MSSESKSAPVELTLAPTYRKVSNYGTNSNYGECIGGARVWISPKSNGDSPNWRGSPSPVMGTFLKGRSSSQDWRNIKPKRHVNAAALQTAITIHKDYFSSSPNDVLSKPKLTRGVNFGEFVKL